MNGHFGFDESLTELTLADLAQQPIWVGWRVEMRGDKPTKVPINPTNGWRAKSDSPATWTARSLAEEWVQRESGDGIGVMFASVGDWHLGGVDLDTCRDPETGKIQPWAAQIIERLASYAEVSPSGTGVKIFFTYPLALKAEVDALLARCGHKFARTNGASAHPPAIEVYTRKRYFAVTTQQFGERARLRCVSLADIRWLVEEAGPAFCGKRKNEQNSNDHSRSGKAWREGARLKAGGATYEQMREAFLNHEDDGIRAWAHEKGAVNYERELKRIYDRASDPPAASIEELNREYMFVMEAGKATIFHETTDPRMGRVFYERSTPADFKHAFDNVCAPGSKHGLGTAWLQSPLRRQYLGGVVFDPANRHRDNQLNLWRGFAFEAKPGSWQKLTEHIFNVVCGGNEECFDYLMKWMANAVQNPARQGEVVVVMRGVEGCGKGIVARALVRLFGQHGLHVVNARHLVSHFNAHLQDCVVLFADEAFFAGDKAHVGVLKGLITEPTLAIEGKFRNPVQTPNFLHIMMASNNDWVVPASLEARRFFVLDVPDAKVGDYAYFKAIVEELENGGYEAMLYELMNTDLSDFDVRKFPHTEALEDQKLISMPSHYKWLYNCLARGFICESRLGSREDVEKWFPDVTTNALYASYESYCRQHHERQIIPRDGCKGFGAFLKEIGYSGTKTRDAFDGEQQLPCGGPAVKLNKLGRPAYHLGALCEARRWFEKKLEFSLDWPTDEKAA